MAASPSTISQRQRKRQNALAGAMGRAGRRWEHQLHPGRAQPSSLSAKPVASAAEQRTGFLSAHHARCVAAQRPQKGSAPTALSQWIQDQVPLPSRTRCILGHYLFHAESFEKSSDSHSCTRDHHTSLRSLMLLMTFYIELIFEGQMEE